MTIDRNKAKLAAIADMEIPKPVRSKDPMPADVLALIHRLKQAKVYSQTTYDRDIWAALYRLQEKAKK